MIRFIVQELVNAFGIIALIVAIIWACVIFAEHSSVVFVCFAFSQMCVFAAQAVKDKILRAGMPWLPRHLLIWAGRDWPAWSMAMALWYLGLADTVALLNLPVQWLALHLLFYTVLGDEIVSFLSRIKVGRVGVVLATLLRVGPGAIVFIALWLSR